MKTIRAKLENSVPIGISTKNVVNIWEDNEASANCCCEVKGNGLARISYTLTTSKNKLPVARKRGARNRRCSKLGMYGMWWESAALAVFFASASPRRFFNTAAAALKQASRHKLR